ncbi:hypothetical protein HPC49_50125 [Pyxidicoccus fallax]|uniref:Uncharacterized protein n=1 Tax=Pyxidicoccus fallax TaxID=394095 RepID=A0A848M0A4_9BACT|nr:hypothetical protein [Pyxidicoccus fallax]NMO23309.1 hypothetical protein [Pyxidicoccus fallax]NPC86332.1 hypothetical protein [Pyxidicoccus fallax]
MPINLSIFFRQSSWMKEQRGTPEGRGLTPAPRQAVAPRPVVRSDVSPDGRDSFEAGPAMRRGLPQLNGPGRSWSTIESSRGHPSLMNEAAQAQRKNGWAIEQAAVAQSTLEGGCGEASLAFIHGASLGADGVQGPQPQEPTLFRPSPYGVATQGLIPGQPQVNLDDGTTAQEMGVMLGGMGINVTQGLETCDAAAMSNTMRNGQYMMAMVDSNALLNAALGPDEQLPVPGELHWVTIDGFNSGGTADPSDDMYRVKDPVHGEYWVSAKDFQQAVEQGKQRHGGGGILTLEKRQDADTQEERGWLARENAQRTSHFSKAGGHGSRRRSMGESS